MLSEKTFKDRYYAIRDRYYDVKAEETELKTRLGAAKFAHRRFRDHRDYYLDLLEDIGLAGAPYNAETETTLSTSGNANELYLSSDSDDEAKGLRKTLTVEADLPRFSDVFSAEQADDASEAKELHIKKLFDTNILRQEMNSSRRNHISDAISSAAMRVDDANEASRDESLHLPETTDAEPATKRRRKITRDERTEPKVPINLPCDSLGRIVLPAVVGRGNERVIVLSLGRVIHEREGYHSPRYIFPVGFRSRRQYVSMTDSLLKGNYLCEIVDGGDAPTFRVTPEDENGQAIDECYEANSASGAWKKVMDRVHGVEDASQSRTHASGPALFGFSLLAVVKAVQELPGAEKCSRYVMQQWITDAGNEANAESIEDVNAPPEFPQQGAAHEDDISSAMQGIRNGYLVGR